MRVAAVVPTFRNLRTLPAVLEGLTAASMPVIVVDDGSDDGTHDWLVDWAGRHASRWALSFAANRGKGAALVAGLERAREMGFDCAVTVDSDGQHRIEDALRLAAAASSDTLVLGAREERVDGYPARSLFGRRLWALGVRSLTGLGVADPVCGLRCYPLAAVAPIACDAGRYAWEEELLVRAAWAGITIRQIPIETVYLAPAERISHFRGRDWLESVGVFASFAARRLLFRAPRYRPRGPLAQRDRSWRRILGLTILVGGGTALFAPPWLALLSIAWIARALHAPWILALATTALTAWLATWMPMPIVAAALLAVSVIATQAARLLCSN